MARVIKRVRPGVTKSIDVKNLGWFFHKARRTIIDRFDMWQSNDGWEMFVDFADGDVFQTHYASRSVFEHVMSRQRSLHGVAVAFHLESGDVETTVLGASQRRGS